MLEQWRLLSTLSQQAQHDLKWWAEFTYDCPANCVLLWPPPPTRELYTDASSTLGYSDVLSSQLVRARLSTAGGPWKSLCNGTSP